MKIKKKINVMLRFVFLFNRIESNKYRNTRIISFLATFLPKLLATLLFAALI
jgi:hypothetical protein